VLLTLFELTLRVLDHGSFTDIAQLPVTAEVFSPAVLFLTVVSIAEIITEIKRRHLTA